MQSFRFAKTPLDSAAERRGVTDPACGGYASFEGWVRDHNDGRPVLSLDYEAFAELAGREGNRIVAEACEKFAVLAVACVHRTGALRIGDLAVWVGVAAAHRGSAFDACRYVIDEAKARVPIWKKEHYATGGSKWIGSAPGGRIRRSGGGD